MQTHQIQPVSEENLAERLKRVFDEAVAAGRFSSRTQILNQCGLSTGYFSELEKRIKKNGSATLNHDTAQSMATVLGIELYQLLEPALANSNGDDKYPERTWAIVAARALQLPEAAIQSVMSENVSGNPGRLYWFHRIETEAERLRPASGANR